VLTKLPDKSVCLTSVWICSKHSSHTLWEKEPDSTLFWDLHPKQTMQLNCRHTILFIGNFDRTLIQLQCLIQSMTCLFLLLHFIWIKTAALCCNIIETWILIFTKWCCNYVHCTAWTEEESQKDWSSETNQRMDSAPVIMCAWTHCRVTIMNQREHKIPKIITTVSRPIDPSTVHDDTRNIPTDRRPFLTTVM